MRIFLNRAFNHSTYHSSLSSPRGTNEVGIVDEGRGGARCGTSYSPIIQSAMAKSRGKLPTGVDTTEVQVPIKKEINKGVEEQNTRAYL